MPNKTVTIRDLDKDAWKAARLQAIEEGIKLADLIALAILEYIERRR